MSLSLAEELDVLRKMMRKACKAWGDVMPQDLADWWTQEQQFMVSEKAAKDAVTASKRAELQQRMAELQAKLDALV